MPRKRYLIFFAIITLAACGEADYKNPDGSINGQKVYDSKCAVCHGEDGKLGASGAKDLTKSILTLEQAVDVISNGKGAMSSFKSVLKKDEIEAVAQFIQTLKPTAKKSIDGKTIYSQNCSICHGDDGKLNSGGAKNLTSSTINKKAAQEIISKGKGAMMPFNKKEGGVLSENEIEAVTEYIQTLKEK